MADASLHRALGLPGAIFMGLGAILGTGVFVSLAVATGVAGSAILPAVLLAGLLAICNGLSSAQLAAAHPVSGGTYEYGYRWLSPVLGFSAGWMFLAAKSASAATAALGLAGYLLHVVQGPAGLAVPLALGSVALFTLLVAAGIRRGNQANLAIVSLTLAGLAVFVLAGLPAVTPAQLALAPPSPGALLEAAALVFVAYTGYGRIATLGEEVRQPARTIPLAIIVTLGITVLLYGAVALVAVGTLGAAEFAATVSGAAAPLEQVAAALQRPGVALLVSVTAITAMGGVLLNLLLGLSRVVLAMARRGDLPPALARVEQASGSPRRAVLLVGGIIATLTLAGDVRLTWSFSALTVLVYYALTNLAALRLEAGHRLYPRAISWAGLAGCLGLAWWLDGAVWASAVPVLLLGLLWHRYARRRWAGTAGAASDSGA
ncbi:MAG: APC family permease [Pseudomonadota bacterium]|nr:APC family permease [Pseudomonadota bacterium]